MQWNSTQPIQETLWVDLTCEIACEENQTQENTNCTSLMYKLHVQTVHEVQDRENESKGAEIRVVVALRRRVKDGIMVAARALREPVNEHRGSRWRAPSCRVLWQRCCWAEGSWVSTGKEPQCGRLVTPTPSPASY